MKKQFLTFLCAAASLLSIGQTTFQKNLVSPAGNHITVKSIKATSDGGMLAGGYMYDSNWTTLVSVITKVDASGQLQWSKEITPDVSTSSYDMQLVGESQNGGYFALLQDWSTATNYAIAHFDGSGNADWTKAYNVNIPASTYNRHVVKQAPNGDYIINISTYSSLCVLRTDNVGNLMWGKTFLGDSASGKCPGFDCEITAGGDILLTGKRDNDRMLVKIDQYGQVLWTKIIESGNYTHLKKIVELPGGDFMCAGLLSDLNISQLPMALLLRMDASGNTVWRKIYNYVPANMNTFAFYDMERMSNGDLQLAAMVGSTTLLIHTDSLGNILESKTVGINAGFMSYEIPDIEFTTDGLLAFSASGDLTLSTTGHINPLLKLNPFLTAGNACGFENCTITSAANPEPINLAITSGMTTTNVGTLVPGITFSTTPITLQLDELCQLLTINDPAEAAVFSIYPNPVNANESITLSFAHNFTGTIQLFDMKGSLAKQQAVNGLSTIQLETGNLGKGIYLVRATNGQNETSCMKIIVE
jgi:hypothetical protein